MWQLCLRFSVHTGMSHTTAKRAFDGFSSLVWLKCLVHAPVQGNFASGMVPYTQHRHRTAAPVMTSVVQEKNK